MHCVQQVAPAMGFAQHFANGLQWQLRFLCPFRQIGSDACVLVGIESLTDTLHFLRELPDGVRNADKAWGELP